MSADSGGLSLPRRGGSITRTRLPQLLDPMLQVFTPEEENRCNGTRGCCDGFPRTRPSASARRRGNLSEQCEPSFSFPVDEVRGVVFWVRAGDAEATRRGETPNFPATLNTRVICKAADLDGDKLYYTGESQTQIAENVEQKQRRWAVVLSPVIPDRKSVV